MNNVIENKIFSIGCNQTGVIIDKFSTLKDAENALVEFEECDKREGIYEPDSYEIRCKGELINDL